MNIKDKEIWDYYTQNVKAVRKPRKSTLAKPVADKAMTRRAAEKITIKQQAVSVAAPSKPMMAAALERKREKTLRQGDFEIEAKLDLHGLTQSEAFEKLASFMQRKVKAGKRQLLIITGKGRGGDGVLRRSLEMWLGQLPETKSILALRQAAPKHGGEGAFYVLLRKPAVAR